MRGRTIFPTKRIWFDFLLPLAVINAINWHPSCRKHIKVFYAQSNCHKSQRFSYDINFVSILIKLSDQDSFNEGKMSAAKTHVDYWNSAWFYRSSPPHDIAIYVEKCARESKNHKYLFAILVSTPTTNMPRRHKANKIMEFFSAVKKYSSRVHFHPDPKLKASLREAKEQIIEGLVRLSYTFLLCFSIFMPVGVCYVWV